MFEFFSKRRYPNETAEEYFNRIAKYILSNDKILSVGLKDNQIIVKVKSLEDINILNQKYDFIYILS